MTYFANIFRFKNHAETSIHIGLIVVAAPGGQPVLRKLPEGSFNSYPSRQALLDLIIDDSTEANERLESLLTVALDEAEKRPVGTMAPLGIFEVSVNQLNRLGFHRV